MKFIKVAIIICVAATLLFVAQGDVGGSATSESSGASNEQGTASSGSTGIPLSIGEPTPPPPSVVVDPMTVYPMWYRPAVVVVPPSKSSTETSSITPIVTPTPVVVGYDPLAAYPRWYRPANAALAAALQGIDDLRKARDDMETQYKNGQISASDYKKIIDDYNNKLNTIDQKLTGVISKPIGIEGSTGTIESGIIGSSETTVGSSLLNPSSDLNSWGGHSKSYYIPNDQTMPTGEGGTGQEYICPCCHATFTDKASYDAHVSQCCNM